VNRQWLTWTLPVLLGVVALYGATAAREITFGDAGEIATAVARLGVIHPTGYPLYTLVGHVAVRLLPVSAHLALAWLNVVFALGTLLFCAASVHALAAARRPPSEAAVSVPAGLFSGLVLATSPALWTQVRIVEVYALHALVVSAVLFFLARFEVRRRPADLAGVGSSLALGAAHHATTALLAVCVLLFLLVRSRGILIAWWPGRGRAGERRVLLVTALAAALALGSYALLPVAARHTDAIAWGDPTSPAKLLYHATAGLYRQFVQPGSGSVLTRASGIPSWLIAQVAIPWLALAAWGAVLLLRSVPAWAVCAVLFAAVSFGHGTSYAVGDYHNFFLPAVAVVAVFAGRGAVEGLSRLSVRQRPRVAILAFVLVFVHALLRVEEVQGDARSAEPYIAGVLSALPPGSVYLTARDDFTFPLWYARHVQGRGRDVAVVNVFMLSQPWYVGYLANQSPGLDLGTAGGPAGAVAGRAPRYPPEIRAHSLVAANLEERRVFERNLFSYRFEGRVGRRWDGPAFDRPSARWALLNRGFVNEIVPFAAIEGFEPCNRDRLVGVPTRVGGIVSDKGAYQASNRPRLLEQSALGSEEDSPYLELTWLERWSFFPRRPDRRGRRLRHGVRLCVFDARGRRVHTAEFVSGETERSRVTLPRELAGERVTLQACTVGELLGERRLHGAPCLYPILEFSGYVP
jgi:hypothetical protein